MGTNTRSVASLAIALALAAPAWTQTSQSEKQEAAKEAPGLKIGDRAPAFKLKDQNEKDVALADLLKKGPVALVFYRSASW